MESKNGGEDRLTSSFKKEINKACMLMGEDPVREIPEKVILDFLEVDGYRAGCLLRDRTLVIDKKLSPRKIKTVLRREAFITLLPKELDDIPHIYDLAWAYATKESNWWNECTSRVVDPSFPLYDVPSLFEGKSEEERISIVRTMLKLLKWALCFGKVEFRDYFCALLSIIRPSVLEFSKSEVKILAALARNPYLSRKELSCETRLSQATISRTLKSLMNKGVVTGPEQVDLSVLRMKGLIVEVESPLPGEQEIICNFPFTYRIYFPLMSQKLIASILLPRESIAEMRKLLERTPLKHRYRLSPMSFQSWWVNPKPVRREEVLEKMASSYRKIRVEELKGEEIRVRLTKTDLAILNLVLQKGRVSASLLEKKGIRSGEDRLRKLRDARIIYKVHYISGIGLGEPLIIQAKLERDESWGLFLSLSRVASLLMAYLEGDFVGAFAIAYVRPEILPEVMRALKMVLKDRLVLLDFLLNAEEASWAIPIEFWNEKRQKFEASLAIKELFKKLSSLERK